MTVEKKRRTGHSVGSQPAPEGTDCDIRARSWGIKTVHSPMAIPGDRKVPANEILKRSEQED